MKVEKLEIYKKQLLLTLSGVFVLLSNTVMASDVEDAPAPRNTFRSEFAHHVSMNASKKAQCSFSRGFKDEQTVEDAESFGIEQKFSAKGSIFGIELGSETGVKHSTEKKRGYARARTGEDAASTEVSSGVMTKAGHTTVTTGRTDDRTTVANALAVVGGFETMAESAMTKDEKRTKSCLREGIMQEAVKEKETARKASKSEKPIKDGKKPAKKKDSFFDSF